jgi:hypothetical protein
VVAPPLSVRICDQSCTSHIRSGSSSHRVIHHPSVIRPCDHARNAKVALFLSSRISFRTGAVWVLRDRGPCDFIHPDCKFMRETVNEAKHNTPEELEDGIPPMIRAIRSQMAISLQCRPCMRVDGGDLRHLPRRSANSWTEMILKLHKDLICNQRE